MDPLLASSKKNFRRWEEGSRLGVGAFHVSNTDMDGDSYMDMDRAIHDERSRNDPHTEESETAAAQFERADDGDLAVADAVHNTDMTNPIPTATKYHHDSQSPLPTNRLFHLFGRDFIHKSLLVALWVASVIGLVTGIIIALAQAGNANSRNNEQHESGHTSDSGTINITTRAACIDKGIKNALLSDPSTLNESTSPQSRARDWILNEDPGGLLVCDAPNLIQRWALATFYFATTKDNTNWLGGCGSTNDPTDMKCTAHALTGLRKDGTPADIDTPINELEYYEIPNQNQWLKATNECTWYGVECFGFDEVHVTDLVLGTLFLIHCPIERFSSMYYSLVTICISKLLIGVFLEYNRLKGTIPKEIGVLNSLEAIFLMGNSLTGTIPTEVGMLPNLFHFLVPFNDLTGTIPEEVYTPGNLELINVKSNMISGTISSGIGQLKKLLAVYYADNLIQGSIPSQLGNDVLLGKYYFYIDSIRLGIADDLLFIYIHFNFLFVFS
jgi:hypothetical protein